jgi:hypothetical protein
MDSSPSSDSEVSSPTSSLKSGTEYIRQGRYIEGAVLFVLAPERLSSDQMQFAATLDAFVQSHTSHWQGQQAFFLTSKSFAEAEQQTQLFFLEGLLSNLKVDTNRAAQSQAVGQPFLLTHSYHLPHLTWVVIHPLRRRATIGCSSGKTSRYLPTAEQV